MASNSAKANWGKRLVYKVVCPNCWLRFYPEEVLFIAKHPELLGDPVAGSNEYARFLPTRFTVQGEAVDGRGFATSDLACPRCHLQVPESMLEVKPVFISIVGSPASGKSYFLTTMTWELRQLMPRAFLTFSDADPVANSALHEYEQTLFLNAKPDEPTEIRKTQTDDPRLYRTSRIDEAAIRYPVPFQFTLWPTAEHPYFSRAHQVGRILILYDNAGEDFLPGVEDINSAAVQHLARSSILFFLFDPAQDPRTRVVCQSQDPQLAHGLRPGSGAPVVLLRQETLLRQAAVRIRRYHGMSEDQRVSKPLIVIVPKFDILESAVGISLRQEPYVETGDDSAVTVDTESIEQTSESIRRLFRRLCPEFVATAESLSSIVRYVPTSSLGQSPEYIRRGKRSFYGIRPKDVRPEWVTVPLLYCLAKWAPGLVGAHGRSARQGRAAP